ncbi:MAG: hypothetical protein HY364_00370 [Candidatus Aenigmarchaeota archaeon]|nr:hypothetical protein [Candidatus Aenigmarchaeota archaeon]
MAARKMITKDGKTLQVALSLARDRIKSVSFSGDFYLYPEESIRELEKSLEGITTSETEYQIATRLMIAIRKAETDMAGVTCHEMAKVVKKAIDDAEGGF